jgi:hypothetical protein
MKRRHGLVAEPVHPIEAHGHRLSDPPVRTPRQVRKEHSLRVGNRSVKSEGRYQLHILPYGIITPGTICNHLHTFAEGAVLGDPAGEKAEQIIELGNRRRTLSPTRPWRRVWWFALQCEAGVPWRQQGLFQEHAFRK